MTLDAFKNKYRLILTDEMIADLDDLVAFIQKEMELSIAKLILEKF